MSFVLIAAGISAYGQTTKTDANDLRQKLQTNLDEWHKNGKFAGATLGVCLADEKCFAL